MLASFLAWNVETRAASLRILSCSGSLTVPLPLRMRRYLRLPSSATGLPSMNSTASSSPKRWNSVALNQDNISSSLPLNRGGRLTRDVVHHARDALHLVHDAARADVEEVVRQTRPVRGHEVDGFDR